MWIKVIKEKLGRGLGFLLHLSGVGGWVNPVMISQMALLLLFAYLIVFCTLTPMSRTLIKWSPLSRKRSYRVCGVFKLWMILFKPSLISWSLPNLLWWRRYIISILGHCAQNKNKQDDFQRRFSLNNLHSVNITIIAAKPSSLQSVC